MPNTTHSGPSVVSQWDTTRWQLMLIIWVVGSVWVHLFYIKRIRLSEEPVLAPIRIADGTALRIQLPGRLFKRAGSELKSAGVHARLNALADYLKTYPRRRLTITGFCTPAESRSSLIANLGAVRARAVQLYLLNAGVPDDQLHIEGRMSSLMTIVQDSVGALAFSFNAIRIDAVWLAQHQKYIDLFHPMQLYFPTGSTEYIHTPDNERFASEAIAYLRMHPRERLVLIGHTDSVGTAVRNLTLSRLRATAVRDRFVKEGASKRWLQIIAQGDLSPIASNSTIEGREANRRVTMVMTQ